MNLKELKELIQLLKDTDISELEIERSGVKVRLKKGGDVTFHSAMPTGVGVPGMTTMAMGWWGGIMTTTGTSRWTTPERERYSAIQPMPKASHYLTTNWPPATWACWRASSTPTMPQPCA